VERGISKNPDAFWSTCEYTGSLKASGLLRKKPKKMLFLFSLDLALFSKYYISRCSKNVWGRFC